MSKHWRQKSLKITYAHFVDLDTLIDWYAHNSSVVIFQWTWAMGWSVAVDPDGWMVHNFERPDALCDACHPEKSITAFMYVYCDWLINTFYIMMCCFCCSAALDCYLLFLCQWNIHWNLFTDTDQTCIHCCGSPDLELHLLTFHYALAFKWPLKTSLLSSPSVLPPAPLPLNPTVLATHMLFN